MSIHTSILHIHVDEVVKTQATQALTAMGLTISDAVQLFLQRVAIEQSLPFALRVPNSETLAAMAEADDIIKTHRARFTNAQDLFDAIEKETSQQYRNYI